LQPLCRQDAHRDRGGPRMWAGAVPAFGIAIAAPEADTEPKTPSRYNLLRNGSVVLLYLKRLPKTDWFS
jgi:hypothetical protein